MDDKYEFIEIERNASIATVWLNRPEAANALHPGIMREIEVASRAFLEDEQSRVVVFRGRGKHFCSGVDLKQSFGEPRSLLMQRRHAALGARMIQAMFEINQVTIAALHGAAVGGGACLPLACDFRIATEDSFCKFPEVDFGLNLPWLSLPLCVRLIGPARAKRMIMLCDSEDSATLLEWGFIDERVSADQFDHAVQLKAERYAAKPPVSVQMTKKSINAVSSILDGAIMHMECDQSVLAGKGIKEAATVFTQQNDE